MDEFVSTSDLSERNEKIDLDVNGVVFKPSLSMLSECTLPPPQCGVLAVLVLVCLMCLLRAVWAPLVEMNQIFFNPHLAIVPDSWLMFGRAGIYSAEVVFVMTWAFLYALDNRNEEMYWVMFCLNLSAIMLLAAYLVIVCTIVATADKWGMSLWGDWRLIARDQFFLGFVFVILKSEFQRERSKVIML